MNCHRNSSRVSFAVSCALVLIVVSAASQFAQTAAPPKGEVQQIKVHGKSLEGNLEGNSPERDVFVYLPPGYAGSANARYPVVYLLHGYGLTAARWMTFANIAAAADRNIAAGTMREMILVSPDAFTAQSGSMYSASLTTGDWEAYIAEDLVAAIDSRYRTIPSRASRGLAGHSMGGYGTIRIGMKRPDVFSGLYMMSSCCLLYNAPGQRGQATGERGPATPAGNPAQAANAAAPAAAAPAPAANASAAPGRAATAEPAGTRGQAPAGQNRGGNRGRGNAQFAQAAAWSANPNNPPQYFDLPVVDGQSQPLIVAKWIANSPMAMIDQYRTNLLKYTAIMSDVGTEDSLANSNRQLAEVMTRLRIPLTYETYTGGHNDQVAARMESKVLPFFSRHLAFTQAR